MRKLSKKMENVGILVTWPLPSSFEQELSKRFKVFRLWETTSRTEFLKQNSESIRAILGTASAGVDSDLIDSLPNLEIVSTYSVGYDKIDLAKCKERGIRVTNTPDVVTDDVADAAIGLALATLRKISVADSFVRDGLWKNGDFQLSSKFSGKSIGIIGFGRIGYAIAKRAESFGCNVSYNSRTQKTDLHYRFYSSVIDLARNCEILFVSCSLNEETRHIVNKKVIDALGPKGTLINIGRGSNVDEKELVSALMEGRLGGAGLDVYEDEPNVPEELFQLENVLLLPHVGTDTFETCNAMADLVLANLEAHFLGKPLLTPVL